MTASAIEWTDDTWNPMVGCSAVSPGCANCYAERFVHRGLHADHRGLTKMTPSGPTWTGEVRSRPALLREPLTWRKPRRVFVNSLSDMWHANADPDFLQLVFAVMAATPHITYQVLTKRPWEALAWYQRVAREAIGWSNTLEGAAVVDLLWHRAHLCEVPLPAFTYEPSSIAWPLPNVWVGVSVENQQQLEREAVLRVIPAAVRFLSIEPLLGTVNLEPVLVPPPECTCYEFIGGHQQGCPLYGASDRGARWERQHAVSPDWVIVGGESGPGARPCAIEWVRDIRDDCRKAGVACFVKQLGAVIECDDPRSEPVAWPMGTRIDDGCTPRIRLRDPKGGDMDEWPADLRVREFPDVQ